MTYCYAVEAVGMTDRRSVLLGQVNVPSPTIPCRKPFFYHFFPLNPKGVVGKSQGAFNICDYATIERLRHREAVR